MKFRKKPVIVEATQWFKNGDHPLDYVNSPKDFVDAEYRKEHNWEGDVVHHFRDPNVLDDSICWHCSNTMLRHGWIKTLEGGHIVCPGDWIITGVKGEHYPCKPDIFEETYERVDNE